MGMLVGSPTRPRSRANLDDRSRKHQTPLRESPPSNRANDASVIGSLPSPEKTRTKMPSSLWDLYRDHLADAEYTDLTHSFFPGMPHFHMLPDEERNVVFDFPAAEFRVHKFSHVGQWGTHVDPPSHFVADGRPADQIPVSEMLLPLVVIDISSRVVEDPDAVPTIADVEKWESKHGRIPKGAFVALRTDWYKRWPDAAAFDNKDAKGRNHAPGWSLDVLKLLLEERGATAFGHEGTDTDPGSATSAGDYSLERYILAKDRWQIELMANLDKVPEAGALVMATWPKPKDGSGFPARVIAIHSK
ncbi:cyclase family protein [Hyaloraphidium curvatum]|nr:cyclase family protein [Hyaloraphidium curvatum]